MKFKWELGEEDVNLVCLGRYAEGGGIALGLETKDGEPFCDVTVNLMEPTLPGYVFIDHDIANDVVAFMEENGFGKYMGRVSQGYAIFPSMKLDVENVKDAVIRGKEWIEGWENGESLEDNAKRVKEAEAILPESDEEDYDFLDDFE